MDNLKYKVIKSKAQYNAYCKTLETLLETKAKTKATKDEIDLLMLLIETWDEAHNTFYDLDPVQLLLSLMAERNMKATALAEKLGVSKGLVSDILNYKKGMSKEVIRGLAALFSVSQDAFNRQYDLETANRKKDLVYA
jgi:HTH-type transcriptional regulator/antitoxin HigA